jgi:hypothetical protein
MKAKLTALLLGILFLFPLTFALAQTDDTTDSIPLESPPCQEILDKIDTKIMNYELNQAIHMETYQMLYVKVNAAVKRAEVMGYDTEEIEADLVELDILTTRFQDSFETFITNIEQTRDYTCTESNDIRYAQSFISTQKSLGEVKSVVEEISLLYEDEIREHLLGLSMVNEEIENE